MIGDRAVSRECLAKADSKDLVKYTNALISIVFTPTEMQTCSLSGKTSNFQAKIDIVGAKDKLPEKLVDSFISTHPAS